MKVLITGGLGYLGGRISQHLSAETVRILARKNGQRIPEWADKYEIVEGDVLDDDSLLRACKGTDVIVHLAALNEIDSGKYPFKAMQVNAEGTLRLLQAASACGVERFIYFSTFHVYGSNAHGRITEETVTAPYHPYAISHHAAEDFVRMMVKKGNISGAVLRLSNGFGYPSHPEVNRWTLAFNDFCLQAVLNNRIILKTSGKQHRDFVTLTDVSRCAEHFIANKKMFSSGNFIYNLGGKCSISIRDAAELVADRYEKFAGSKPDIVIESNSIQQSDERVDYSIEKLEKTGYSLSSNINEEIDKTILFCKENMEVLRCRLK